MSKEGVLTQEKKRPSSNVSNHGSGDLETAQAPELKRELKARHLQMIAIGMFHLITANVTLPC